MNIRFDWYFDDGDNGRNVTAREMMRRNPVHVRCYLPQDRKHVSRSGTVYDAGLTRSQRRLHAALARTKPWHCPHGQPEWFTQSPGRGRSLKRVCQAIWRSGLRRCRRACRLTARQLRLKSTEVTASPGL